MGLAEIDGMLVPTTKEYFDLRRERDRKRKELGKIRFLRAGEEYSWNGYRFWLEYVK